MTPRNRLPAAAQAEMDLCHAVATMFWAIEHAMQPEMNDYIIEADEDYVRDCVRDVARIARYRLEDK